MMQAPVSNLRRRIAFRIFLLVLVASFLSSGVLRFLGAGSAFATALQTAGENIYGPHCTPLADIDVLIEALNAREIEIENREHQAALKEADLELARAQIEARLQDLAEAEQRLADRMAASSSASQTDLDQLIQVYETMKPTVAAELFASMEPAFAAEFLVRMSPQGAGAIFSNLAPDVAYALSATIAGRNAHAATE